MPHSYQGKIADFAEMATANGAEFRGLQHGPNGALVLFTDRTSRTTLAIEEINFTVEALRHRLEASRREYAACTRDPA
jgi:hypothetical protein